MSSVDPKEDPFWYSPALLPPGGEHARPEQHAEPSLSLFESVVTSYPPVLESFVAYLPTVSLIDLYHTSRYLRGFLKSYPLAWRTLSFRVKLPILPVGSAGSETPDGRDRSTRTHALDSVIVNLVAECGSGLRNLDICNTTVSGVALLCRVLQPRHETLEHLSVRGCKNVSIKYHIIPFLQLHSDVASVEPRPKKLALKSLYTYRCRHHRRRPYLPSSLIRRDSDSEPTHELIELCHQLGIWTDTAWCPTPGGRCYRRKDYHAGRVVLFANNSEVWVPFDRLWRSGNRIGVAPEEATHTFPQGLIWEDMETGYDGEPLGTANGPTVGEGKHVPAHLRRSHKIFVEKIKCDRCREVIPERCEQCSVRMHCMGCRRTLCASCAFDRPIYGKRKRSRDFTTLAFGTNGHVSGTTYGSPLSSVSLQPNGSSSNSHVTGTSGDQFWWAPGAARSPNLMTEVAVDGEASDSEDSNDNHTAQAATATTAPPPRLNMHWCCLEPIFSGGGGIAFVGPNLGGRGAKKIRAAPLPQDKGFEDADFLPVRRNTDVLRTLKHQNLYEHVLGEVVDIVSILEQTSVGLQTSTCPRSLCQDCYKTYTWRVTCHGCKRPLCKEHDFRSLKIRKCGFRNLSVERDYVRAQQKMRTLGIPAFKSISVVDGQEDASQITAFSTYDESSSVTGDIADDLIHSLDKNSNITAARLGIDRISSPADLSASSISPMVSNSHFGAVSSRQRSSSLSSMSTLRYAAQQICSMSPSFRLQPLPCHPRHPVQWKGCGAFFCQQYRPVGDPRPRCRANLEECGICGVNVCEDCQAEDVPCRCGYCASHYHCPPCARKPLVLRLCRRKEEETEKNAAAQAEQERASEEELLLSDVNFVAQIVGEFFQSMVAPDDTAAGGESDPLSSS